MKINELSELYSQRDILTLKKQELIDQVITAEVKAKLDEINAEFAPAEIAVNQRIDTVTNEVKAEVIAAGETIKGNGLMAVFAKGRISWDTKALDGYAAAHPEIDKFRTEGAPTVSIRKG